MLCRLFLVTIGGATVKDFVSVSCNLHKGLHLELARNFVLAGRPTTKCAFKSLELESIMSSVHNNGYGNMKLILTNL